MGCSVFSRVGEKEVKYQTAPSEKLAEGQQGSP
jgi:hypothetical protein